MPTKFGCTAVGCFQADGVEQVPIEVAMREIAATLADVAPKRRMGRKKRPTAETVGRPTLKRMEAGTDYLPGETFIATRHKAPNGYPIRTYSRPQMDKLKAAMAAAAAGRWSVDGVVWVSLPRAVRELRGTPRSAGYLKTLLQGRWREDAGAVGPRTNAASQLNSEKLESRRFTFLYPSAKTLWFQEEQIKRIKQGLLRPREQPKGHMHRGRPWVKFDGVWKDGDKPIAYALSAAARLLPAKSKESESDAQSRWYNVLTCWTRKLPRLFALTAFHPNKLSTEPRLVPGTKALFWESISADDLTNLQAAMQEAARLHQKGKRSERLRLSALCRSNLEPNQINASSLRLVRKALDGAGLGEVEIQGPRRSFVTTYDLAEVAIALNGQPLLAWAHSWIGSNWILHGLPKGRWFTAAEVAKACKCRLSTARQALSIEAIVGAVERDPPIGTRSPTVRWRRVSAVAVASAEKRTDPTTEKPAPIQRPEDEPSYRQRIAEFEARALEQQRQLLREQAEYFASLLNRPDPLPPSPPGICSLGECQYQVDGGGIVTVSAREDAVLQAFLIKAGMNLSELVDKSGYPDANRILRGLEKYGFGPAIRLPGKRNAGGYHVQISAVSRRTADV